MNVVAIFDIGKTNKKVFLFNENYKIVWEKSVNLEETKDEDGFPCEDIEVLKNWILDRLSEIKELKDYVLKAINFSTYGASFVYIDENGKVLTPLYNYLKEYPDLIERISISKNNITEIRKDRTAVAVVATAGGIAAATVIVVGIKNATDDIEDVATAFGTGLN